MRDGGVEVFPGYFAFRDGTIWSKRSRGRFLQMRPEPNEHGYIRVCLRLKDRKAYRSVHSLVAEAFIGPRPDDCDINHRNGDKADNRAENLEYISRAANIAHAFASGLAPVGENHWAAKITDEQAARIQRLLDADGHALQAVADVLGVSRSTVRRIRDREFRALKSAPPSAPPQDAHEGVAKFLKLTNTEDQERAESAIASLGRAQALMSVAGVLGRLFAEDPANEDAIHFLLMHLGMDRDPAVAVAAIDALTNIDAPFTPGIRITLRKLRGFWGEDGSPSVVATINETLAEATAAPSTKPGGEG